MPFSVIAGYWCSLVREVVLYGPLLAFYADSTPTVYVITYPIVPDRRAVNTRLPVSSWFREASSNCLCRCCSHDYLLVTTFVFAYTKGGVSTTWIGDWT